MEVKWSAPARSQLRAVIDYLSVSSPQYASKLGERMTERTEVLRDYPRMGRVVPKLDDQDIRELFVDSWRLLYSILDDEVLIVAVVHSKKDISEGL